MRNIEFKDDQKVFAFINSDICNSYQDLCDFLYDNLLPFRERWIFYLLGKLNLISDETISDIPDKSYTSYGGYIKGEVYYWKEYLENEYYEKNYIEEKLKLEGKEVTNEAILRIYLKRGFDFVDSKIENDINRESDKLITLFEDQIYFDNINDNEFCEACHETPCMCSHKE
ncbi:hypothetical protein M0M57_00440 [Flavobacterium azooxidireducens]|uniref:Uncharacterized protein n=1 Tax=Flavobacterium azooxidireducens TaxID=1871076 RepID=A0ABY4KET6_9FLAO|nr:hypothetical protein [Flavobacterium azooxidireducens]UPQ79322.1 hypothetical protein M0M57_00440 [Flavobacterium azooxidireducens]